MKRLIAGIVLALAGVWSVAAEADVTPADQLVPMMTYVSASSISSSRTYGSYTGVGSLFVAHQSTATTGFGDLCTGALVANNVVLTAAHCLYGMDAQGNSDPVTSITYYLPSLGEKTDAATYTVSNFTIDPTYNGVLGQGNDLALFTLTTAATGHDVYGIYTGDPMSAFTRVGTGTVGDQTGTGGGVTTQDYVQRTGNNLYEYYGDEVFSGVSHNVLMMDFDDGTEAHDVFGQLGGNQQTGIAGESDSSPGDSGGPTFINGLIAGVTSFGTSSFGCGANSVDPYASSTGACTNSSVGELAGDTWVAPNSAFIANYVATANPVPEPATWAMLVLGFGVVGGALRRNRAKAVLA